MKLKNKYWVPPVQMGPFSQNHDDEDDDLKK